MISFPDKYFEKNGTFVSLKDGKKCINHFLLQMIGKRGKILPCYVHSNIFFLNFLLQEIYYPPIKPVSKCQSVRQSKIFVFLKRPRLKISYGVGLWWPSGLRRQVLRSWMRKVDGSNPGGG